MIGVPQHVAMAYDAASAAHPIPSVAELMAEIRHEIQKSASPWCDRAGAAAHCCCSVTSIDKAANEGKIKRRFRDSSPMFRKTDLDKWIESSPAPASRIQRNRMEAA